MVDLPHINWYTSEFWDSAIVRSGSKGISIRVIHSQAKIFMGVSRSHLLNSRTGTIRTSGVDHDVSCLHWGLKTLGLKTSSVWFITWIQFSHNYSLAHLVTMIRSNLGTSIVPWNKGDVLISHFIWMYLSSVLITSCISTLSIVPPQTFSNLSPFWYHWFHLMYWEYFNCKIILYFYS